MSEMNIVRESGWEEEEEPVKGRAKKGVEVEPEPRTLLPDISTVSKRSRIKPYVVSCFLRTSYVLVLS